MKIKGILFDKDGTLIDFHKVWGPAAKRVAQRLCAEHYFPEKQEALLQLLGVRGEEIDPEGALAWKSYKGIAEDIAVVFGGNAEVPALTEALNRLFYEEVGGKLTDYPTFTDVRQMIRSLRSMGVEAGIATSDGWESTRSCLTCLHALEEFSFLGVTGINIPEKPDGRLIGMAARKWGIFPSQIAVVGDTPNDMRFAKNGNAVGIAVRSGLGTDGTLAPLADYLIDSTADLSALIESINNEEREHGEHYIEACI